MKTHCFPYRCPIPTFLLLVLSLFLNGPFTPIMAFGESSPALQRQAPHPLDDLTQDEIKEAVSLIKGHSAFGNDLRFAVVMTREPAKEQLITWEKSQSEGASPAAPLLPREAWLVLYEKMKQKMWEAIVDLDKKQITSLKEIKNRKPPLLLEDYDIVPEFLVKDPRWQEALKKRGITDMSEVYTDVWAPGLLSAKEKKSKKRIGRVVAFHQGKRENVYARPIEGLIATVDLDEEKVIDVWDQEVVPRPEGGADLDEKSNSPLRTGLKPLQINQPKGPSFQVQGQSVSWENWNFRLSMQPIKGLVLYQVRYHDNSPSLARPTNGPSLRSILYKGQLSEMLVPYGENGQTWTFRNAFDVGEYGIGLTAHPLVPHEDLPENAVYFDAVFADSAGETFVIPKAYAIYERDGGILWKHYDTTTEKSHVRRARQLVVTFLTTIGNYDYGIDWVFHQDGTLEVETRLTGILLGKGSTFDKNLCEDGCEHLVEPYIKAPNHQHFFSFRLDLDVDGSTGNTPVEINTKALPRGKKNQAGNVFEMFQERLKREKAAMRELNLATSRKWKVMNSEVKNSLGHPVGYGLIPGENSIPYIDRKSPIRQRGAFINHHIWFTRYHDEEQSAAGDFPNQREEDDGLSKWVKDNEELEGQDVVLWYTLGVTHVARPAEWPVMPVHRTGFKLIPMNFFSKNPGMDVPVKP